MISLDDSLERIIFIMLISIFNILKVCLALALAYSAFLTYASYQASSSQISAPFAYSQYSLSLLPQWNASNHPDYSMQEKSIEYSANQQKSMLVIRSGSTDQEIPYSKVGIEHEDAIHIKSVKQVQGQPGCFKIESGFFTLVYCMEQNSLCYSSMGKTQYRAQYFFADHSHNIWVFSHPNHNVLLLRVYGCSNQGHLVYSQKLGAEEKIQSLSQISHIKESLVVKSVTFSRNIQVYTFNLANFTLTSLTTEITHRIESLEKTPSKLEISIRSDIKKEKFYEVLGEILYTLTAGRFGTLPTPPYREPQNNYDIQVLDTENNLILELNHTLKRNTIVSLSDVLLPFRSPVFISRSDLAKQESIEDALNISKHGKEGINFRVYQIKSKSILEVRNKIGVYQTLPNSNIHFMSLDEKFLNFYPHENLQKDEYYTVRTPKGGVVFQGNKIKGLFSDYPISDQDESINYGRGRFQRYHQLTAKGKEVGSGIYEAHIVHKGLFTYLRKNRMDLVSTTTGKSVLTHYFGGNTKDYVYSDSFIENNEFWVFEHKQNSHPLITKYELYLNSSTPKSLLNIKRQYQIPVLGKITRVQKCIDGFYYFDYISWEGKYGFARQHHALMSNRQRHPEGKEAGKFERAMVIENIERNKKLKISPSEEQLLTVQIELQSNVVSSWKHLELKHQFAVLPYRVYLHQRKYYHFNIRKLLIQAYDSEMSSTKNQALLATMTVLALSAVLLFVVAILAKDKPAPAQSQGKVEKSGEAKGKEEPKKHRKKQ